MNHTKVIPELIEYGFIVIPLQEKRPILKEWNKLRKTPTRLDIFHNRNIGIVTGEASGITVLDIDIKDDGLKIWRSISSAFPEIKTPMVRTPSGGLHIYFKYNKQIRSFSRFKLRNKYIGWDLLNNDRQVVAPPSVNNEKKKKYKWIIHPSKIEFAKIPRWLEDYLLDSKSFK